MSPNINVRAGASLAFAKLLMFGLNLEGHVPQTINFFLRKIATKCCFKKCLFVRVLDLEVYCPFSFCCAGLGLWVVAQCRCCATNGLGTTCTIGCCSPKPHGLKLPRISMLNKKLQRHVVVFYLQVRCGACSGCEIVQSINAKKNATTCFCAWRLGVGSAVVGEFVQHIGVFFLMHRRGLCFCFCLLVSCWCCIWFNAAGMVGAWRF